MMEAHTTYGAEILVEVEGLRPLTPTVALEHHRSVDGSGYPDLGDGAVPHLLSQIVAVADIYEAMTGARLVPGSGDAGAGMPRPRAARRDEAEHGARQGVRQRHQLLPARLGRPHGSRRDRRRRPHEQHEPLHPVIALIGADYQRVPGDIDTSARGGSGEYERHVVETLRPQEGVDFTEFLAS